MEIIYDMPVLDFFEKEQGILQEHWESIANNKDVIKLDPDIEKYVALQECGVLRTITFLEGDRIVGYSALLLQPHLHYAGDIFAGVDVIYIAKDYRKGRLGLKLIDATERWCRELGVSVLTYHTKPAHPAIETILYRKDYVHMENIIGKCLR